MRMLAVAASLAWLTLVFAGGAEPMIERVNQSTTPGDPTWGTKSRLTLLCMIALVSGVERLAAQEKVEVRGVTSNGKGSSSLPIFVLLRADNVQNDGSPA
jgi:hypothetical protein